MIRAIFLTVHKEFRLLSHDIVGLFMLIVAPIAVVAAAGFSLANVYAGASAGSHYVIAVADQDGGAVGHAVTDILSRQATVDLIPARDGAEARSLVREQKRALVAIIVPRGTTAGFQSGHDVHLILYSDPVRYLQVAAVDLRLAEMCRQIGARANQLAAATLTQRQAALREQLGQVSGQLSTIAGAESSKAQRARAQAERKIRARINDTFARDQEQARTTLDRFFAQISAELAHEQQVRVRAVAALNEFFARLAATKTAFEQWMGKLKALAGSHASDIPPPPAFPAPPPADIAQAASAPPPDLNKMRADLTEQLKIAPPDPSAFSLPPLPAPPKAPNIDLSALSAPIVLPGSLGLQDRDSNNQPIELATGFNTFDLQVPGFGITFLLIGMLMGISLAVIDEHDWGTLERLRSVAAPFAATLAGKLVARFIVGFAQLVILFAAGWMLFGISLGSSPAALLMPTASIAFAGAAFGLMVAGAGSRDSVLPIGAIVIMTVAAIGGCWWPIDFEPPWMRIVALAVPTTWTMQAYNDLMIRGLPAISAVVPSLINLGFGLLYMTIGLWVVRRRFG